MSPRDSWRNKLPEEKMLGRIDRAREGGGEGRPKTGAFEEVKKVRLHQCHPGDWVRQVFAGKENYGPLLRVLDPKAGLLETRDGRQQSLQSRTQVVVQI